MRGRIGERRCVDQEVQGQERLRHRSKPKVRYTPFEALKMATHDKAHLLKLSGPRDPYPGDLGVVKEGALADLILVDGNPLEHTTSSPPRQRTS